MEKTHFGKLCLVLSVRTKRESGKSTFSPLLRLFCATLKHNYPPVFNPRYLALKLPKWTVFKHGFLQYPFPRVNNQNVHDATPSLKLLFVFSAFCLCKYPHLWTMRDRVHKVRMQQRGLVRCVTVLVHICKQPTALKHTSSNGPVLGKHAMLKHGTVALIPVKHSVHWGKVFPSMSAALNSSTCGRI